MPPNAFSKEERVAFEQVLEGFQDALVLSKNVTVSKVEDQSMQRARNVMWKPQPYIAVSYAGTDMTLNWTDYTQLSVPCACSTSRSVPWMMDALELRDALANGTLADAAKQKLASDINTAITNVASFEGSLVVKRTTAAAGYDDVAQCETIMNEQGVPSADRCIALSTRDYNGLANNLAGRGTVTGKVLTAYDRSYIGQVCSFDAFKLDFCPTLALAAGGAITVAAGPAQSWVPVATSTATTGEQDNVDNRRWNLTVSATAGVKAGDAFTIAGVNALHHITKADTGQLKTFRVVSVVDGTTLQITPPVIADSGGGIDAELEYANCSIQAPGGAAITWLNTAAARLNPFWHKNALEILGGRYAVPADAGAGVLRGTTDQGIELVMQKQYNINTMRTAYRLDTLYGVVNKAPEMSGIIMFSQP